MVSSTSVSGTRFNLAGPCLVDVEVSAELLDVDLRLYCGTDDAIRGLALQVVFGLPCAFFLQERELSHPVQGSTTVDAIHK